MNLGRLPGWEPHSYGYHGDDGHAFHGSGLGRAFGPRFTTGDVVGALLDRGQHTISFYKCVEGGGGRLYQQVLCVLVLRQAEHCRRVQVEWGGEVCVLQAIAVSFWDGQCTISLYKCAKGRGGYQAAGLRVGVIPASADVLGFCGRQNTVSFCKCVKGTGECRQLGCREGGGTPASTVCCRVLQPGRTPSGSTSVKQGWGGVRGCEQKRLWVRVDGRAEQRQLLQVCRD